MRTFADQLERLELAVEEAVAGHRGMVTIGAISSAMFDVLPGVIERFKQDHPHISVSVREIDSVEAVPALEAGDIAISMLTADHHVGIAKACLAKNAHFVSSSYIAPEMRALDDEFRAKGYTNIKQIAANTPGVFVQRLFVGRDYEKRIEQRTVRQREPA